MSQAEALKARLLAFLPCLRTIELGRRLRLGVDYFERNSWKLHGELSEFAAAHDPARCCGFDLARGRCEDELRLQSSADDADDLNRSFEDRHARALQYLRAHAVP